MWGMCVELSLLGGQGWWSLAHMQVCVGFRSGVSNDWGSLHRLGTTSWFNGCPSRELADKSQYRLVLALKGCRLPSRSTPQPLVRAVTP